MCGNSDTSDFSFPLKTSVCFCLILIKVTGILQWHKQFLLIFCDDSRTGYQTLILFWNRLKCVYLHLACFHRGNFSRDPETILGTLELYLHFDWRNGSLNLVLYIQFLVPKMCLLWEAALSYGPGTNRVEFAALSLQVSVTLLSFITSIQTLVLHNNKSREPQKLALLSFNPSSALYFYLIFSEVKLIFS